jgi:hypothetical protein
MLDGEVGKHIACARLCQHSTLLWIDKTSYFLIVLPKLVNEDHKATSSLQLSQMMIPHIYENIKWNNKCFT